MRAFICLLAVAALLIPVIHAGGGKDINQNHNDEETNGPGGDLGADPWPIAISVLYESGPIKITPWSANTSYMELRQTNARNFSAVNIGTVNTGPARPGEGTSVKFENSAQDTTQFVIEWWFNRDPDDIESVTIAPGEAETLFVVDWETIRISMQSY